MKFVLASTNQGKIKEMREILKDTGARIVSREELGIDIEVAENGATFMENALLKAEAIRKISGLPAIADDSGLCVEALDGAPGIYSSTYGGESLDDSARCAYLLKKLENVEHRSAKFVCTIVCSLPDGGVITAQGECHGEILKTPRGSGGFGYDPVFLVEGDGRSMAELSQEEKNSLSHRGEALRKFAQLVKEGGIS